MLDRYLFLSDRVRAVKKDLVMGRFLDRAMGTAEKKESDNNKESESKSNGEEELNGVLYVLNSCFQTLILGGCSVQTRETKSGFDRHLLLTAVKEVASPMLRIYSTLPPPQETDSTSKNMCSHLYEAVQLVFFAMEPVNHLTVATDTTRPELRRLVVAHAVSDYAAFFREWSRFASSFSGLNKEVFDLFSRTSQTLTELRCHALTVMNKTFLRNGAYPIETLSRILGFSSVEEATQFLSCVEPAIKVDDEGESVRFTMSLVRFDANATHRKWLQSSPVVSSPKEPTDAW